MFTTVHTAHHGRAADGGAVRRGGLRRARDAERSAGGRLPGEGARPERGVLDRGRRPRPQPPGGAAAPPAQPMPRQHPPTPTTESAPHHGSCGRRPGCQRRRGATPSRWSTVTSPPTTWCPPCSRAASPSSTPPSSSRSSYRACDPPPAFDYLPLPPRGPSAGGECRCTTVWCCRTPSRTTHGASTSKGSGTFWTWRSARRRWSAWSTSVSGLCSDPSPRRRCLTVCPAARRLLLDGVAWLHVPPRSRLRRLQRGRAPPRR